MDGALERELACYPTLVKLDSWSLQVVPAVFEEACGGRP